MRLVWTSDLPDSVLQQILTSNGHTAVASQLPAGDQSWIVRRFPVLVSETEGFIREAFSFLFNVAFVRGATRSERTLSTYAESLLSWLCYAEQWRLQWRQPNVRMIAAYRDHMLGTSHEGQRPLSRRTVNLRLTVLIGFYEHLGIVAPLRNSVTRTCRSARHCSEGSVSSAFHQLRVRVYSRRPKALTAEQCRALSRQLRLPHRLAWQWAVCTGLRTSSLVRIELSAITKLRERAPLDRSIELPAKGGRIITVHVPDALLRATERYIATDRILADARRDKGTERALFLNHYGRALTGKAFYQAIKRASRSLNFRSHPHQARTTFATHVRDRLETLGARGVEVDAVKVVQSMLAHADASTTEQYLESIDVPSLDVLAILEQVACETAGTENP